MWCVGKSTGLDGETWILPALHQPGGILGKLLYLPDQSSHSQPHRASQTPGEMHKTKN
jgi:hypothetical protein